MVPGFLALSRLFYVPTPGRVVTSLIRITIRREERRAPANAVRDVNETPEERIKIPQA